MVLQLASPPHAANSAALPCLPPLPCSPLPSLHSPALPPPSQVWVYEEADERGPANLYVHHSLMLPAFPLAVAWLDCDPSGKVRVPWVCVS